MTRSPMPTHALIVPSIIKTTAVLEERFYEFIQNQSFLSIRTLGGNVCSEQLNFEACLCIFGTKLTINFAKSSQIGLISVQAYFK